jgi:hypothetical protein
MILNKFYKDRYFSNVCLSLPLPNEWEEKITANNEKYFINHVTKKTQWEDPRLSICKIPKFLN